MASEKKQFVYSISFNLLLITIGALIFSIGVKAIVVPKGFITGGIAGVSLLAYYFSEIFSPGIWYLFINIPLFIIGWALVSLDSQAFLITENTFNVFGNGFSKRKVY